METFSERRLAVLERIGRAAARSGRDPSEIGLVAVSKTHPAGVVREAWEAGQRIFGESRVQEALPKIDASPGGIEWHFIGHLQTNKVRKALGAFTLFHGVDSADLARAMDRIAGEEGLFPRVLLEVNLAGESTKFGFSPDALEREIDSLLALGRVQVEGLMTIPPPAAEPGQNRPFFAGLRALRDQIAARSGVPLDTLSMGMSADFEVAVEEGATLVRVGTTLFGERPKPGPSA